MKRATFLTLAAASSAFAADIPKDQLDFFEGKIRPILADNCYKCHSVERNKNKGGLTLDTRDGVLKGGDSGAVIKPGDPESSLLIKAIRHTDPDPEKSMPPKNGGGKLPDKDIAALTEWVKMGAPDPRLAPANGKIVKLSGLNDNAKLHWSYQPLAEIVPPEAKAKDWVKNPVDAFVLTKLEASGMSPNGPATREALIRRVTFDLTGLPPTPQEVAAFVNDQAPNAWEKVIDRLLASPHYGERWGRHWLDTARYSDTTGGPRNNNRMEYRYAHAWTFRDYVVQSFNADKPYNQFVVEQLAADRIPDIKPDDPRLAGLGFLTVGERFPSRNDEINDRIDVVTKGFLGLTVTCARCHDHMFDPIPTEDYYALHGVFASSVEPPLKPLVGEAGDEMQRKEFMTKEAALQKENRDTYYRMVGGYLADFREKAYPYLLATLWTSPGKLDSEDVSERARFIRNNDLDENVVRFVQQRLRNPRDPVFGPWAQMMDLTAEEFAARAKEIIEGLEVVPEAERVSYSPGETIATKGGDKTEPPKRPLNPGKRKGKETPNPIVVQLFKSSPLPKTIDDVARTYEKLFVAIEPHAQAYLRQAAAATDREMAFAKLQPEALQIVEFPMRLFAASELTDGALREALQRMPKKNGNKKGMQAFAFNDINTLQLTHPGAPARAMVMTDSDTPRNSPVFIRGQQQNRGDIVPRRFLEILTYGGKPQPFHEGSGRWELGQAIATHPLTARVAVNRIWMHHFGEGIVPTPDDLGVQSEKPSHPELLEYLAGRFIKESWSQKKMHKLVLMSATYQQSTNTRADYEQRDPANRLLWRANIRRLDFEAIRDSLLSFSGKLDPQLGGKPINLTDEPYSYRRSVYGYIDRGNLPELMSQFDFSDPDMPNSKRATSIVPQQALFLMNSPMAVDVARKVVERPEFTAAKDDQARLRAVYAILFQRSPSATETQMATQFLAQNSADDSTATFSPADAKRAMARAEKKGQNGRYPGQGPIKNQGDYVERKPLTPWELYTHALLFTNEMAYVN